MPKSCGKFDSGYNKHAYTCEAAADTPTRSGWSPPYEFANGPYSTNCTAAQLRLRKGHCLKHAQNRWISGELLRRSTWSCRGMLNTNCMYLRLIVHPLHTHPHAHLWPSKTPTSERPNMPKSCGKFDFGYKKHACNSWGCPDIPTRSGWSPPHEFTNGLYSTCCTAAQLRLQNGSAFLKLAFCSAKRLAYGCVYSGRPSDHKCVQFVFKNPLHHHINIQSCYFVHQIISPAILGMFQTVAVPHSQL